MARIPRDNYTKPAALPEAPAEVVEPEAPVQTEAPAEVVEPEAPVQTEAPAEVVASPKPKLIADPKALAVIAIAEHKKSLRVQVGTYEHAGALWAKIGNKVIAQIIVDLRKDKKEALREAEAMREKSIEVYCGFDESQIFDCKITDVAVSIVTIIGEKFVYSVAEKRLVNPA